MVGCQRLVFGDIARADTVLMTGAIHGARGQVCKKKDNIISKFLLIKVCPGHGWLPASRGQRRSRSGYCPDSCSHPWCQGQVCKKEDE